MTDPADDLAAHLIDAVGEWLADQGGGFLGSFTFCMEYVDADGDRAWGTAHNADQTPSTTLGLLRWHTLFAEGQCAEMMWGDEA